MAKSMAFLHGTGATSLVVPRRQEHQALRNTRKAHGSRGWRISKKICMAVRLGQSSTYVSELGCGTIAWGDPSRGYGDQFQQKDVNSAVAYLSANGVNFFDCAEVYGYQSIGKGEGAEQLLGDALSQKAVPVGPVVSSKLFPLPWAPIVGVGGGIRLGRRSVIEALRRTLTRLGTASIDLYYIHFPAPFPGLYDGIADCVDAGLVKHIGVSNHSRQQLRRAFDGLSARGVQLVANQFRFNVLDRSAEMSGLLEETLALGMTPVAYEPLAQGLLTGKYTDNEVSPGRKFTLSQLKLYRQLTNLMRFLGAVGGSGKPHSITEVALAYVMSKGMVAIPGIKTEGQAREAVRALDWTLSRELIETLDEKSDFIARQRMR